MRAGMANVRLAALPLACLVAFGSRAGAQIAIQVRNGTVWASSLELKTPGPATLGFRYRWDGTETPTRAAWQRATVTPTSTAGNRASDVIDIESEMELPPKTGVYKEFVVITALTWPKTFYIRVRINVGQKSVYSRWVTVNVVAPADVAPSPTCTVHGVKSKEFKLLLFGDRTITTQPITQAEVIQFSEFRSIGIGFVFRNPLSSAVKYRHEVIAYRSDQVFPVVLEGTGVDPQVVRTLAGRKADTIKIPLIPRPPGTVFKPDGRWRFWARAVPLNGISSKCELRFDYIMIH